MGRVIGAAAVAAAFLLAGNSPAPSSSHTVPPPQAAKPSRLTKAHQGWRQTLCFQCHEMAAHRKTHQPGAEKPAACGPCHGYNGAPHEDHAIAINSCADCHRAVKHFGAFQSPGDCIGCHYHPQSPQGK